MTFMLFHLLSFDATRSGALGFIVQVRYIAGEQNTLRKCTSKPPHPLFQYLDASFYFFMKDGAMTYGVLVFPRKALDNARLFL